MTAPIDMVLIVDLVLFNPPLFNSSCHNAGPTFVCRGRFNWRI